jgi:hypothetical protein
MEPGLEHPDGRRHGLRVHEQRLRQGCTSAREIEGSQALAVGGIGLGVGPIAPGGDLHDGLGRVRPAVHELACAGVVRTEVSKSGAKRGAARRGDLEIRAPSGRMTLRRRDVVG